MDCYYDCLGFCARTGTLCPYEEDEDKTDCLDYEEDI